MKKEREEKDEEREEKRVARCASSGLEDWIVPQTSIAEKGTGKRSGRVASVLVMSRCREVRLKLAILKRKEKGSRDEKKKRRNQNDKRDESRKKDRRS